MRGRPEVQTPGGNRAISTNQISANDDSATARELRKALDTIRARLAIRGFALLELVDGSFMVSRWNLSKPLATLQAAEDFARQVGA